MKLILLGSGGVIPPPKPGCKCKVCLEARKKGVPYSRTGPSLFIEDINVLFDLPEEIRAQLNRENINKVEHVILTHWHPDHTLGIRILEQLNWDFEHGKAGKPIKVYISKYQLEMFKKMSCGGFLDFYEKKGIIKVYDLQEIKIGKVKIRPILIDHTKGYCFEITDGKRKIVYAPCEYYKFNVDKDTRNIDVFIVHNLFWEDKTIGSRKIPPSDEDSFEQMLGHAEEMGAKQIILTHIEENFGLGHDELNKVLKRYKNVKAGFDGMKIWIQ